MNSAFLLGNQHIYQNQISIYTPLFCSYPMRCLTDDNIGRSWPYRLARRSRIPLLELQHRCAFKCTKAPWKLTRSTTTRDSKQWFIKTILMDTIFLRAVLRCRYQLCAVKMLGGIIPTSEFSGCFRGQPRPLRTDLDCYNCGVHSILRWNYQ